ncbi:MAG TPA: phosphatidylserine decarboxylase family protein [candidate division Zixibacteria bacterium]|nr:phosphatidylserine decarboxylase family protein [candidate division Zixibacteria bacterium]HBZ01727.1 phosphatidylserine decarboxylase family protein [candidate division Zixibacteria bacterium]
MTKEGYLFPLPFFIAGVILFVIFFQSMSSLPLLYLAALLFYLGLFVMLFFRDPDRKVPQGENLVVSPADGKIIRIDSESENPSLSIFLSITNVHVNRSPVEGVINSVVHRKGKFHGAFRKEAMNENERNEIEIETSRGLVWMNQVAGYIARRTICNKKPGDKLTVGERIGLIRFGSRVDLTLPPGSKIDIRLGQKVRAGETILGNLS